MTQRHHSSYGKRIEDLTVVVVDDCKPAQSILKQIFFPIGVKELRFFTDARQALKEIRIMPPDLIVTDWIMPDLDGQAFVRRIRNKRNHRLCTVPVVVLTGLATHYSLCLATMQGIQAFVTKPVSTGKMSDIIKMVIADSRKFFLSGDFYRLSDTEELLSRVINERQLDIEEEDSSWKSNQAIEVPPVEALPTEPSPTLEPEEKPEESTQEIWEI